MHGKKAQNKAPNQHKLIAIISTLLFLTVTTACQTTEHAKQEKMAHVLDEQKSVIDVVMVERQSAKVQSHVQENETLATAEAHLSAALESLKQSNAALKEAIKHEHK